MQESDAEPNKMKMEENTSPITTDDKIEKTTMMSHVSTAEWEPQELCYPYREQNLPVRFKINELRTVRNED